MGRGSTVGALHAAPIMNWLSIHGERATPPKPQQIFEQSILADQMLARLFQRHFGDPISALRRLENLLSLVELPFDLKAQLRELDFFPQPEVPNPQKFVYYFVPNSRKGTDKIVDPAKFPDPLHQIYLNKADEIN